MVAAMQSHSLDAGSVAAEAGVSLVYVFWTLITLSVFLRHSYTLQMSVTSHSPGSGIFLSVCVPDLFGL